MPSVLIVLVQTQKIILHGSRNLQVASAQAKGTVEKPKLTECHSERSEESPYKSKRFFGRYAPSE
jgi:hypothetical protein